METMLRIVLLAAALAAPAADAWSADVVSGYIEKYFETFPSRATEAGRHDRDRELEDLTPGRLRGWLDFNRRTLERLSDASSSGAVSQEDRLDAELLQTRVEWELHELDTRRRPARDPLFWTNIAANATVFLLVRDDRPCAERLSAARSRVTQLPRLCRQARSALAATPPGEIAPDFARIASGQARASARFYRQGFARLLAGRDKKAAAREAAEAAAALERLASFLDDLARRAGGSPRLGADYGEALRIATGEPDPESLLARATEDLAKKTPAERDAFFRDFNHHFNVMITPHEILPGHYLQLKVAAHHPRKARALFPDGVYVEGWGTFCERLMLDLGWGGPLDRLAHLKKQMENIARAIVDVSVHTKDMPREEVIRLVQEQALQDEQFASNMWTRAITSPTQITTYYLGYGQVRELFDDVKAARGGAFRLKEFMDSMLAMGPVPVARYRQKLLRKEGPTAP